MRAMTRRDFARLLAGAGGCAAAGWPLRAAWSMPGDSGKTLRFTFFTDVHADEAMATSQAVEQAAVSINRLGADIAIAGGDLITEGFGASAQAVAPKWDIYMKMHQSLKADVFPVLGNHDLCGASPEQGARTEPDPRRIFRQRLGLERTWYSIDAAGYHFMVLDSVCITGGDTGGELQYQGHINATQREWIRADLSRCPRNMPIILATHIPLLTVFHQATRAPTAAAPPSQVVGNAREVLELFAGRNLILVLQGHMHVNEMIRWGATMFITGGAVCGGWWRGPWHGTGEGCGVVTLSRNRIEWDYVEFDRIAY